MSWRLLFSRFLPLAALVGSALAGGGCAGLRLPRIDPTGERVFVWPRDQVPAAPALSANPFGNALAPPVLTDPVFPQPPQFAQPNPIAVGQPILGGVAGGAVGGAFPVAQDKLTITPERVLAPVGSEVLLRTGICTAEGFLLADQRIEWTLSGQDTGEIVELGGRGWLQPPLLPWNQGKKRDNHFATGYTASVPLCITRGTADPADDVQVRRGDAWVSVTSATEGTSHVTALARAVESWQHRRATATIYWVDVQWTFPPPTVSGSAGQQVLTTTVTRQTDSQPLEGWLVRYEVAGGGGTLAGGGSSQVVEVLTGADGKASVDVTPTGSFGSSQINTQLVRPARWGGSDSPRLIIGSGTTTINWNDTSPYLSSPEDFSTLIPTYPIPGPISGNGATQPLGPTPTTPPPALPASPARKPRLEVEISGATTAQVDGQATFDVLIRNSGDGKATNIVLTDRFDPGLRHQNDTNRELEIKNTGIGNLFPGGSKSLQITFDVLQAGRLCHDVSVTCSEGSHDQKRACIDAANPPLPLQPAPITPPSGPARIPPAAVAGSLLMDITSYNNPARVGTRATYQIVVRNASTVIDKQVTLRVLFPPELAPDVSAIKTDNVLFRLVGNEVRFDPVATLRADERLSFTIVANVKQPGGGDIVADLVSRNMPQKLRKIEKVEIIR